MIHASTADNHWHALTPAAMQLGESPRFAHGQLRWVDITARTLHTVTLDQLIACLQSGAAVPQVESRPMPDQIACIVPTQKPDCWIGCGREGIWMIHDEGPHARIVDAPFDNTWQRFNDGCCDEWGRLWISSLIDDKRAPVASLWCLSGGVLEHVMDGLTTGNGMAYSKQHRKLWVGDTFTKTVRRFNVKQHNCTLEADGWQTTWTVGTERPDGACMLDENHYAVAVIDGHRLDVFNLNSTHAIASIPVPLNKPTMPCIIPKPASALALTSAAISVPQSVSPSSEATAMDGQVLIMRIADAADAALFYTL